jgi:outer membrane protein TolC
MNKGKICLCLVLFPCVSFAQRVVSLTEAENLAEAQHPTLRAQEFAILSAKARYQGLLAPYRPMVSFNSYLADGTGTPVLASTVDPINYIPTPPRGFAMQNLMVMWKVFSSGREQSARALGKAEIDIATTERDIARLDLISQVRIAFSEALQKKEEVASAEAGVKSATELLRITREMFEAGKVPEFFVLRAQADLSRARRRLATAQAEYQSALYRWRQSLGQEVTAEIELGEWDRPLQAPQTLTEALRLAREKRPELQFYAHQQEVFKNRAEMARRSANPEVSLFAMADYMSEERGMSRDFYKAGFILSFPLYDSGMRKAEREEALKMADRLRAEAKALELQIESEVAEAWAEWVAMPAILASAVDEAKFAEEAYKIATLRYEAGKAIQLEVSQALADWVEALTEVASARSRQRVAWARLMRSIGEHSEIPVQPWR